MLRRRDRSSANAWSRPSSNVPSMAAINTISIVLRRIRPCLSMPESSRARPSLVGRYQSLPTIIQRGVARTLEMVSRYSGDEVRFKLAVGVFQIVGHHFGLGQHGHEVGIAVPARHDMEMHMVGDSCARHGSLVYAHVEAIGMDRSAQGRQ